MLTKILAAVIAMGDKFTPPSTRINHAPLDADKELGDSHGIEHHVIRDGHTIHRFDHRGPRRSHRIGELESLLRYTERNGTPASTALFCAPDEFVVVLDDKDRPDIDHASMKVRESTALLAWAGIAGRGWKHVDFKEAIEDRAEDLVEQKLAMQLAKFKRSSSINYDSDLSDGSNISFVIEEKDRVGSAKLPSRFDIEIPLFECWPQKYRLSVGLKAGGAHGEGPVFSIRFRDLADAKAMAIQEMIAHASKSLGKDWLVVAGSPSAIAPLSSNANGTRSSNGNR